MKHKVFISVTYEMLRGAIMDKSTFIKLLNSASDSFLGNIDELTKIDSQFGDGDHGVTIVKIANTIKNCANQGNTDSIKDLLDDIGRQIMAVGGGSAGPLYGTMIGGLADGLTDEDEIDETLLKKMFNACLENMYAITKARKGDKTMMDALIPAVEAINNSTGDIEDILKAGALAAQQGAKMSEKFISKFGRARNYKEQTIGVPDAGAVSTALFFVGLYKGISHNNQ